VEIEAVIRDDALLTPSLEAAIETAREALNNAIKHSAAARISLFSELDEGRALIHIRDNGRGMSADDRMTVTSRLNRRVESVGGIVTLESADAHGTDVKIAVGA